MKWHHMVIVIMLGVIIGLANGLRKNYQEYQTNIAHYEQIIESGSACVSFCNEEWEKYGC